MAARYAFTTPAHHLFLLFAPAQSACKQAVKSISRAAPRRAFHTPQSTRTQFSPRRTLRAKQPSPPRPRHFSSSLRARNGEKSQPPKPDVTANLGSPGSPSLSQRLKKLSREYGWSALGVYLGLSALDFPFCFLAVRMLGVERIGRWEKIVVDYFKALVLTPVKRMTGIEFGFETEPSQPLPEGADPEAIERQKQAALKKGEEWSWGYEEAQAAHKKEATIWTQLALAYAVHKSFIFIRVPLTAAVTPKVVKTLRGWGWDIGKRKPKPEIN